MLSAQGYQFVTVSELLAMELSCCSLARLMKQNLLPDRSRLCSLAGGADTEKI